MKQDIVKTAWFARDKKEHPTFHSLNVILYGYDYYLWNEIRRNSHLPDITDRTTEVKQRLDKEEATTQRM
jgi:hypothetical protein